MIGNRRLGNTCLLLHRLADKNHPQWIAVVGPRFSIRILLRSCSRTSEEVTGFPPVSCSRLCIPVYRSVSGNDLPRRLCVSERLFSTRADGMENEKKTGREPSLCFIALHVRTIFQMVDSQTLA